jgi:hypothetical protein
VPPVTSALYTGTSGGTGLFSTGFHSGNNILD